MCGFFDFFVFLGLFLFSDVLVDSMSVVLVGWDSRATPCPGSGVIAVVIGMAFRVGGGLATAVAVGAKVSLVCFWPGELAPLPLATLVCFDFIPPLGELSLPVVLVGFHLFYDIRLVIVALVALVRYKSKAGSGVT